MSSSAFERPECNGDFFGLLKYPNADNLGDEIQSLAARRFLPRVDRMFDREELSLYSRSNSDEEETPCRRYKTILNGWYAHRSEAWPPSDLIDPLLLSIHIDLRDPNMVRHFLSPESRAYFAAHGPVGARDESTFRFFQENGIAVWYSGCLTLTHRRHPAAGRGDYILLVDLPEPMIQYVRQRTSRPVFHVYASYYSATVVPDSPLRFFLAECFLNLYQSAHATISPRLHTTLPCLAFETPTLMINSSDYDLNRFTGLNRLYRNCSAEEFMTGKSGFDLDDPPENGTEYLSLRGELIDRCREFTGFERNSSFVDDTVFQLMNDPVFFDTILPLMNPPREIHVEEKKKSIFQRLQKLFHADR